MTSQMPSRERLLLYPEPIQAKANALYAVKPRKPGTRLHGYMLVVVTWIVEWIGFVRRRAWRDSGFGSVREAWEHIALTEPRYDPTVYPREVAHLDKKSSGTDDADVLADPPTSPGSENSVARYRSLYLSGELTPLDVVRAILPLIRRDTAPPGEHSVAWLEVKADIVLKAAAASTARYQQGTSLGALDGIPTAIKDEFDLDGYATTLGSVNDFSGLAKSDHGGRVVDSWCVSQLEEAGALILGKLSMNEYGMDTAGSNSTYGTPRNPYNRGYYTGGSSSGSAYAVAAGLVPITLGSDGGGSIRIPASFCAVYGLKPTQGRVSIYPTKNHSNTAAAVGPLAADMRSLAAIYAVLSRPHELTGFPASSRLTRLNRHSKNNKILGIPEAWLGQASPAVRQLFYDRVQWLVGYRGYVAVPVSVPFTTEGRAAHALTLLTDAASLLQSSPGRVGLTPANRILVALGSETPAADYVMAQKLRHLLMSHMAWLWHKYPGMVLVTPTTACAGWPIRDGERELRCGLSDGDQTMRTMEFVWLANLCGLPSISVPAGFVVPEGRPGAGQPAGPEVLGRIPVGLMGTGEWCSEEGLLRFGLDAEEAVETKGESLRPPGWVDVVSLAKDQSWGKEHL